VEETVKKAKAPAKPRKSAAKKTAVPSNVTEMVVPANGAALSATSNGATHATVTAIKASHEQVAVLAHRFWAERGYRHGHDAEDWFRAEHELLRGKAS
jgi:hypothetical protein